MKNMECLEAKGRRAGFGFALASTSIRGKFHVGTTDMVPESFIENFRIRHVSLWYERIGAVNILRASFRATCRAPLGVAFAVIGISCGRHTLEHGVASAETLHIRVGGFRAPSLAGVPNTHVDNTKRATSGSSGSLRVSPLGSLDVAEDVDHVWVYVAFLQNRNLPVDKLVL